MLDDGLRDVDRRDKKGNEPARYSVPAVADHFCQTATAISQLLREGHHPCQLLGTVQCRCWWIGYPLGHEVAGLLDPGRALVAQQALGLGGAIGRCICVGASSQHFEE